MKNIGIIILFSITYFFIGCGNDAKKHHKREMITSVNKLKPVSEKKFKISNLKKTSLKKLENRYKKNNFQLSKETSQKPEIQLQNIAPESNQTNV